jgi:hypothetical protein
MDIDCSREDKKASTIDHHVGCLPGAGMNDPAIPDRDVRSASFGKLNVCEHESGTAVHADKICAGPYSHAVFKGSHRDSVGKYNVFSVYVPE